MAYQSIRRSFSRSSPAERKTSPFAPRPFPERQAPPPRQGAVQRVIVKGDEKGEYYDDATDEDYSFVAQDSKKLLYANRNDLATLRNLILAEDSAQPGPNDEYLISSALQSWKSDYARASKGTEKAFKEVRLLLVTESEELAPGEEARATLLNRLGAVLGGKGNQWGRLVYKKAGFGERAPKASGTVYVNQDNAVDLAAVADFLGVEAGDFDEGSKFAGVEIEELDDTAYRNKLLLEGAKAELVPQQRDNFFYVSGATRVHKTQSATAGNYVLNGTKKASLDDVPSDDVTINNSYEGLKTDRSVKDWTKVDRVGIRGGTQDQCMDKWNALGMAAYAKKVLNRNDLNLAQDYEWLHIRGVQNGGRNEIANLGTGTWAANSAMIPYENKIRAWGDKKPGSIYARYEATTNPVNSPVLDTITIKIAADANHEIGPIDRADPLEVEFDAQNGSVTDSFANKIKMKNFGLDQEARQTSAKYRSGVVAAQSNNPAGLDATVAEGHQDYLDGVAAAKAGNPANPLKQGQVAGHTDYTNGVAAARAGQGAGNRGHAEGHGDYLAGVADARAGNVAGTGGHALGHADYVTGVNLAAGGGILAATLAGQQGITDYQAGVAGADNRTLPTNWGELQGFTARRAVIKSNRSRTHSALNLPPPPNQSNKKKKFL